MVKICPAAGALASPSGHSSGGEGHRGWKDRHAHGTFCSKHSIEVFLKASLINSGLGGGPRL